MKTSLKSIICLLLALCCTKLLSAEKSSVLESAEALLASIKAQEQPSYNRSEEEDYLWDSDRSISQTIYVEREVQRDVFTSMLVETDREDFIKRAEEAMDLLKKWVEVEKAVGKDDASNKETATRSAPAASTTPAPAPAASSSPFAAMFSTKKEEPAKTEPAKPAFSFLSPSKPEEKKAEEEKKPEEKKADSSTNPLSFLEKFKKDREKKDEAKTEGPDATKTETASPTPAPSASITPPSFLLKPPAVTSTPADADKDKKAGDSMTAQAVKPEDKKAEDKKAEDKPAEPAAAATESKNPLDILRGKRLKAIGQNE